MDRLHYKLWRKLRTGRKPPSFWQRLAFSGISLPLGWSQALISGSPLSQSATKTPGLLPGGSSLDWQEHQHGQVSYRNYTIHKSSRCPGSAQGLFQGVRWIQMRRWVLYAPAAQLQNEIQLRQIRWCVQFLHVFLMLSWFCKYYRWHVLRVWFHSDTLLSRRWLLARSWLPVFRRRPLGKPTWFRFHPLILKHFQMPHGLQYQSAKSYLLV